MSNPSVLIAYFSLAESRESGNSSSVHPGTTTAVAQQIATLTGGTLFCIKTETPYPSDRKELDMQVQNELRNGTRPPLASSVENMADYSTVFIGYPNWWGTMPMPVMTFLEEYDFSGKKLIPFCSSDGKGSGLAYSRRDLMKSCPMADILPGISVTDSELLNSPDTIKNWIQSLKL